MEEWLSQHKYNFLVDQSIKKQLSLKLSWLFLFNSSPKACETFIVSQNNCEISEIQPSNSSNYKVCKIRMYTLSFHSCRSFKLPEDSKTTSLDYTWITAKSNFTYSLIRVSDIILRPVESIHPLLPYFLLYSNMFA